MILIPKTVVVICLLFQNPVDSKSQLREDVLFDVRILNLGPGYREDGLHITLDSTGALFDIDGHPVVEKNLKEALSGNGYVNKKGRYIINMPLTKQQGISLNMLAAALKKIRDNMNPSQRTVVYVYLDIGTKKKVLRGRSAD